MKLKHPTLIRGQFVFTVEGAGHFPIDMLRYDCCWPTASRDATEITEISNPLALRRIVLTTCRAESLTVDRWKSFLWNVVEATGRPS